MVQPNAALTYRQLLAAVDELAGHLKARGIKSGWTVATQMANSIRSAATVFAVDRIGASNLLLDPALQDEEASRYCRRAGAGMILRDSGEGRGPTDAPWAEALTIVPVEAVSPARRARRAAGSNVVLLLSSGSGGMPKIVPKTAAEVAGNLRVFLDTVVYRPSDRVLAVLPFYHNVGLIQVLSAGLAVGATLYIERFSPRETAAAIQRHRLTVLAVTPFILGMLAETNFRARPNFRAVRLAFTMSAALPSAVAQRVAEQFGIRVAQSYGSTETGPIAITPPDGPQDQPACVGLPYAGVCIEIRDSKGRALGVGRAGRIAVKSPANAHGYLGDRSASRATFQGPWVLTGDVGRLDEAGHLFLAGRRRRMINVAGKKVAPAEVEACLRRHPAVADALVVGEPADRGGQRVLAMVVSAGRVDEQQLRDFCAMNLADFKVPRRIERVSRLARGPLGKAPDRRPSGDGEQGCG